MRRRRPIRSRSRLGHRIRQIRGDVDRDGSRELDPRGINRRRAHPCSIPVPVAHRSGGRVGVGPCRKPSAAAPLRLPQSTSDESPELSSRAQCAASSVLTRHLARPLRWATEALSASRAHGPPQRSAPARCRVSGREAGAGAPRCRLSRSKGAVGESRPRARSSGMKAVREVHPNG